MIGGVCVVKTLWLLEIPILPKGLNSNLTLKWTMLNDLYVELKRFLFGHSPLLNP